MDMLLNVQGVVSGGLGGISVVPFVIEVFSGLFPSASRIRLFDAQHFVLGLRHLNISVISAFPEN